jgi:Ethanolamine utilization protein EutJ (predicted chaperonin)
VKSCDLSSGAAKLELAMKSLRVTLSAVEDQWTDQTHHKFREEHLARIEPTVRKMFDEIARMAEAIAAAERDCNPE